MSSHPNKPDQVVSPKTLFWNRFQLIMILIVFVAPIAGAYFYKPDKFSSYGDLYTPVKPVPSLSMQALDGNNVEIESLRRQWIFLVLAKGDCAEACEDNLLKMRQLRFMQNNDMNRIRTLFLSEGVSDEVLGDLNAKYRPIETYRVTPVDLKTLRALTKLEGAPEQVNKDRLYIIDPTGNLMMSYPATADPNMIKKDIKRLLKASQIG